MSANQNASKLRPLPDPLIAIVPSEHKQSVINWFDELVRKSVDPAQLDQNQVSGLETNLSTVSGDISTVNTSNTTHINSNSAHGSNGDVAGMNDLPSSATTSAEGLVKQATAIADLNQTISATYSQAEVQAISDKVDALMAALRTSGALDT